MNCERAMRECPFFASSDLDVIVVDCDEHVRAKVVRCRECGAFGPPSPGDDERDAVHSWNQRFGPLSVVK